VAEQLRVRVLCFLCRDLAHVLAHLLARAPGRFLTFDGPSRKEPLSWLWMILFFPPRSGLETGATDLPPFIRGLQLRVATADIQRREY
jgi:hypothetical protein